MASENETVEDIVRELRDDANKVADEQHDEDCWTNLEAMQIYDSLASRIESAWRREKAQIEADALNTGAFVGESNARRPRRNCDRFATAEEAYNSCPKFCDIDVKTMTDRELKIVEAIVKCLDWLFAPVAEGGES